MTAEYASSFFWSSSYGLGVSKQAQSFDISCVSKGRSWNSSKWFILNLLDLDFIRKINHWLRLGARIFWPQRFSQVQAPMLFIFKYMLVNLVHFRWGVEDVRSNVVSAVLGATQCWQHQASLDLTNLTNTEFGRVAAVIASMPMIPHCTEIFKSLCKYFQSNCPSPKV